jgi:hypothetical protein
MVQGIGRQAARLELLGSVCKPRWMTMKGVQSVLFRELGQNEIGRVWTINRRGIVENDYYLEDGEFELRPEYYDIQG